MKLSNPSLALLAAALLPSIAAATPPPDASERISICSGAYYAVMSLDFGNTGTTATVTAKANVVSEPFSPFPPPPPYYAVYAGASHRANASSAWTTNDQNLEGYGSYPAAAASATKMAFRSATCELAGNAVVSVHCPNGNWEYKTLERTWVGCGL
ncbi:hypothetical protein V1318_04905 [Lysobacter sp. CCNWLW3]|uniref:hypothetical protein n=1 Tax=unclassified Lysobacter TaxID=2635362 RepID=UPI002FD29A1A